jgi:pimeloyl-ACP methyl ester carboxylesterase
MLDRVPSKSFIDAPVASGESRYPVILMSHGDGGNPLIYSTTAEYLASQGSIVVGISHTYNADFTIFKDGSVVPGVTEGSAGALLDSSKMTFNDYLSNFRVGSALSEFYSRDASSALDQLELLNASDNLFNDRMDLTRVGMFGHSFGGSHSFAALLRDSRIDAAADLDGTIFSDAFAEGAPRPFLVISEPTDTLEAQQAEAFAAAGFSDEEVATLAAQSFSSRRAFEASSRAFYVTAKKFLHSNFSDAGILAPLGFPQDNISTEIAPDVALDISNRLLSEFFDQELSGQRSTLLYQAAPFEEVVVEVRE